MHVRILQWKRQIEIFPYFATWLKAKEKISTYTNFLKTPATQKPNPTTHEKHIHSGTMLQSNDTLEYHVLIPSSKRLRAFHPRFFFFTFQHSIFFLLFILATMGSNLAASLFQGHAQPTKHILQHKTIIYDLVLSVTLTLVLNFLLSKPNFLLFPLKISHAGCWGGRG